MPLVTSPKKLDSWKTAITTLIK